MVRDMLRIQEARAAQGEHVAYQSPGAWQHTLNINIAELALATEAWCTLELPAGDLAVARQRLLAMWGVGLSWSMARFDLPFDSETLVQAIARRVRAGQQLYCERASSPAAIARSAAEMLDLAREELFSFEQFFRLAYALGIADVGQLHDAFLAN
jgi:hypothetical protein